MQQTLPAIWMTLMALAHVGALRAIETPIQGDRLVLSTVASDAQTGDVFEYSIVQGSTIRTEPDYYEEYDISFAIIGQFDHAVCLRPTNSPISFPRKESIGSANPVYLTSGGSPWLGLAAFRQIRNSPVDPWRYRDFPSNSPVDRFLRNQTNLWIGFRFLGEAGLHYGWMQFTRTNTLLTTPYELVTHRWHPIPDQPIGAGQPPVIPVETQITPDGQLRLAWSGFVATWILEYCDALDPEAEWLPVPEAGSTEALLPLPEGQRFFRLREPQAP